MGLHDQIEEDLDIFLDQDDMATVHEIGGVLVTMLTDEDQALAITLKSAGGIYEGNLLFFAKTQDLPPLLPRSMTTFDGVPCEVVTLVEADGMSQVMLKAGLGGF